MKVFTILFLLLLTSLVYSQEISIDIKKSNIYVKDKKNIVLLFSSITKGGGLLNVREIRSQAERQYPKGYIIEHFNSKLELINRTPLNLEKREVIKGLRIVNDIVELIIFRYDKLKRSITVKLLSSPLNNLQFAEKNIFIFDKLTYKKYFDEPIKNFLLNSTFQREDKWHLGELEFSKNKNFMVLGFEPTNKIKETHFFFVFDKDYNLVYHKKFSPKKEDWHFSYEDLKIDDTNGNTFLLISEHENNTDKKTKINYYYTLFELSKKQDKKLQIHLNNDIKSLSILLKKNTINLIGFYGDKHFDFRVKGISFIKIDTKNLELITKKNQPFSEQFLIDKYGNNKKETVKNIVLRSTFIDNEENILINAEEIYLTSSSSGLNSLGTNDIIHFDDIISVKLNPKGDLLWARNINKKQAGYYNTTSYTSLYSNDKVYFFFNALNKLKKFSDGRISFKYKNPLNSSLYVVTISKNGIINYKKLIDSKDSEVRYKVNKGTISPKSNFVIFQGTKNNKRQLIKLKF